eukprot:scaffold23857_cov60-Phaeocystis_antarctica.AAC.2
MINNQPFVEVLEDEGGEENFEPIDPCRGVAARRAGWAALTGDHLWAVRRLRFGGSLRAWVDEAV